MCFTHPRPLAWFWFIAAFGTCVALGTWQIQRLQWKEGLIAEIAEAKTKPAITTLPQTAPELAAFQFHTVKLPGSWVPGIEYDLFPRWYQGKQGYTIISPLKLNDGRIVLINRGWIPLDKKDIATRKETKVAGYTTVSGFIRVGAERNFATPKNAVDKNIWFGRDIEEMAAQHNLKNVVPAMIDVVGPQDVSHLPVPSDGTIRVRNDHLSYIITWYGIAAGILTIFLVYHRKK